VVRKELRFDVGGITYLVVRRRETVSVSGLLVADLSLAILSLRNS